MKSLKTIFVVTLVAGLAACHSKKHDEPSPDGISRPLGFHKAVDCPVAVIGTWDCGADTTTEKLSFFLDENINLVLNRLSQENEPWPVNGFIRKYPSGNTITSYCEGGNVIVQILTSTGKSENLVFTPGKGSATMSFKDIRTVSGALDHDSLAVFIQDPVYPTIACTQEK